MGVGPSRVTHIRGGSCTSALVPLSWRLSSLVLVACSQYKMVTGFETAGVVLAALPLIIIGERRLFPHVRSIL